MKISGIRLLGATLCLAVSAVAFAQDASQAPSSPIQITSAAFQDVQVKAADGTVKTERVTAGKVVPGNEVSIVLEVVNTGAEPATEVEVNNPLAAELVFVAVDGTPATDVSVDGGETFGALESLTVIGTDGAPRPAVESDVTNLRWMLDTLAPNATRKLGFRARVK